MDNYIYPYIKDMPCNKEHTKVLGIDTRRGQPILDIKNRFQQEGINLKKEDLFAYAQEAKYYDTLHTITPNVVCGKEIKKLPIFYEKESFDVIAIGEVINSYHRPLKLLKDVLRLLKKGGTLIISLYNMYDFRTLFTGTIDSNWKSKAEYVQLHYNDILEMLHTENTEYVEIYNTVHAIGKDLLDIIQKINDKMGELENSLEETFQRLLTESYWFCIRK